MNVVYFVFLGKGPCRIMSSDTLPLAHRLWKSHIKSFTKTLSLTFETPSEDKHATPAEEGKPGRAESSVSVPLQVYIITCLFSNLWHW